MRGIYVVTLNNVAVTAAITLVQVKAGASTGLQIVSARVSQSSTTTAAMQRVQVNRKSAAATVTSFTPLLLSTRDAAAQAVGGTAATGTNASAEGTDTDVLCSDVFNVTNGWLYQPGPEERVVVDGGGIIGIKFPTAPAASTTYTCTVVFRELI